MQVDLKGEYNPKLLMKMRALAPMPNVSEPQRQESPVMAPPASPMPADTPAQTNWYAIQPLSKPTQLPLEYPVWMASLAMEWKWHQARTAQGTTREPKREQARKGTKRPRASQMQFLLILLSIGLMSRPEMKPPTEPTMMMIPTLETQGAAAPTVTPPVMVPTRASLKPICPRLASMEPEQVPTTLPQRAKRMAKFWKLEPKLLWAIRQFDVNTNVAKMNAVPIAENTAENPLRMLRMWSAGRIWLLVSMVNNTPKQAANRYTQLAPNPSNTPGTLTAPSLTTQSMARTKKFKYQKIWNRKVTLKSCSMVRRPTTAVIRVSSEMQDRKLSWQLNELSTIFSYAPWMQWLRKGEIAEVEDEQIQVQSGYVYGRRKSEQPIACRNGPS